MTFEGPETESQADRQMDTPAAALPRQPDAIGFATLDSQAAIRSLAQAPIGGGGAASSPSIPGVDGGIR